MFLESDMWKTTKGTVLAREIDAPSESNIIAPKMASGGAVALRGEVLASGVENVEVGDVILFTGQGRTYAVIEFLPSVGEELLLNVHELCIVAVIDKDDKGARNRLEKEMENVLRGPQ